MTLNFLEMTLNFLKKDYTYLYVIVFVIIISFTIFGMVSLAQYDKNEKKKKKLNKQATTITNQNS